MTLHAFFTLHALYAEIAKDAEIIFCSYGRVYGPCVRRVTVYRHSKLYIVLEFSGR